jgi:hypothetical protein
MTPLPSGSSRRIFMPKPVLPTPRPVQWKFPALSHATGRVMLALYNPETAAVVTDVRILLARGVDVRHVRIPANAAVKLQLSASEAGDAYGKVPALTVQVDDPVVPARISFAVSPTATPIPTATPFPTGTPLPTATRTAASTPSPTSTPSSISTPTAAPRPTQAVDRVRTAVVKKPIGTFTLAPFSHALKNAKADAMGASTRISRCRGYLASLRSGKDLLGSIKILGCINRAAHRLQALMRDLGSTMHQSHPVSVETSVNRASRAAMLAQRELKLAAQAIQSARIVEAQRALTAAARDVTAARTALAKS